MYLDPSFITRPVLCHKSKISVRIPWSSEMGTSGCISPPWKIVMEKLTWWLLYIFHSVYFLPSAKWLLPSKTVWQQQTLCFSHLSFPNLFKYFNEQSNYYFPIMKYNHKPGLLFRKPPPMAISCKGLVLTLKFKIILTRKKFFPSRKSLYYCHNIVDILTSSAYKARQKQQWSRKNIWL